MSSGGRHLVAVCSYDGDQSGVTSKKILLKTSSRGRYIHSNFKCSSSLFREEKATLYIKSQSVGYG